MNIDIKESFEKTRVAGSIAASTLDEVAKIPTKLKLYPQEKWQWGWNNSSEVWNGRVAMLVFLAFIFVAFAYVCVSLHLFAFVCFCL